MAGVDDLDGVLEQFKRAGNEFVKGNPKPVQELFSHRDDVSLANPFGPPCVDGSRLLRPRTVEHPCSGMARSTTSRP
jgi:hypothetical protein